MLIDKMIWAGGVNRLTLKLPRDGASIGSRRPCDVANNLELVQALLDSQALTDYLSFIDLRSSPRPTSVFIPRCQDIRKNRFHRGVAAPGADELRESLQGLRL